MSKTIKKRLKYYLDKKELTDKEDILYFFKDLNILRGTCQLSVYDLSKGRRIRRFPSISFVEKVTIDSLNIGENSSYIYIYIKRNDYISVKIRKKSYNNVKKTIEEIKRISNKNYSISVLLSSLFGEENIRKIVEIMKK